MTRFRQTTRHPVVRVTPIGHYRYDDELQLIPAGSLTPIGADTGGVIAVIIENGETVGDWQWYPSADDARNTLAATLTIPPESVTLRKVPRSGLYWASDNMPEPYGRGDS